MGNVHGLVDRIDGFDPENPTPLDDGQKDLLQRAKESGRLDFSLQRLTDLPVQIFDQTHLTVINLSVNRLKHLPRSLCGLKSVTSLDLSSNELDQLPEELGDLVELTILNLRHNYLLSLPIGMSKLSCLQKLNVEYNRLKAVPLLKGCPGLLEVKAKANMLRALPDDLVLRAPQSSLDFQGNRLDKFTCGAKNMEFVQELNLSENNLTSADGIVNLERLVKLNLASNRISSLPDKLNSLRNLVELDLRENQLEVVPKSIGSLMTLKKLTLCNNRIKALPSDLFGLEVQVLNVAGNRLSNENVPDLFNKLDQLRELYLGGNCLTSVPKSVYKCSLLIVLLLPWNQITQIEPAIGDLSKLGILHLIGNQLRSVPAEIGKLRSLKELYLAHNALTEIPEALGELKGLELLDLSVNRLTEVPTFLRPLSFLEKIDVEGNEGIVVSPVMQERKNVKSTPDEHFSPGRFETCLADMKGRRWTMEDAMVSIGRFRDRDDQSFWCVFDGHGGEKTALLISQLLPQVLAHKLDLLGDTPSDAEILQALRESFVESNRTMTVDKVKRSGSTGVVVLNIGHMLYVADVGDSRAVLCRRGRPLRVSFDHKPDLPEEERRIRELGGFVSPNGRVVGMLAVSRAFGDVELQPYVSPEPFLEAYDISDVPDKLILACDGVWDVISDQSAVDIVSSVSSPRAAAMKLRDSAYEFSSQDNISVLIIQFSQKLIKN